MHVEIHSCTVTCAFTRCFRSGSRVEFRQLLGKTDATYFFFPDYDVHCCLVLKFATQQRPLLALLDFEVEETVSQFVADKRRGAPT